MKPPVFRTALLRAGLSKIHPVDRSLLLFLAVLLAQSAYSLFVPGGESQLSGDIDIIVRTSSAAILGYLLSGNFIDRVPAGCSCGAVSNTDLTAPTEWGQVPACRALVAPIELATGKEAYYVGKPNPLMMRTGLNLLGVHSQDTAIIGDRMDTDIVAGIECGLDTVLVLSGVTDREGIEHFPYRPRLVLNGVGDIPAAAAQDRKDLVLLENDAG